MTYPFAVLARVLCEQFGCQQTCVAQPRALDYKNRATPGLYFFFRQVDGAVEAASVLVQGGEDEPISTFVIESLIRNLKVPRGQFWFVLKRESML